MTLPSAAIAGGGIEAITERTDAGIVAAFTAALTLSLDAVATIRVGFADMAFETLTAFEDFTFTEPKRAEEDCIANISECVWRWR